MEDRKPASRPLWDVTAGPRRPYGRWVWIAAAIVLVLRLALVPLIPAPWIWADEGVYADCAYRIAHSFEFSARLRGVQPYPPGYSLLLVPAQYLGGQRAIYLGMLVTNCVLVSLVGVLAYYLGRRFLPQRDAFVASLVIAVLPAVSVYPYVVMSENLFLPLLMGSCLLVVWASESRTPLAWFWVGLGVGGLAVTRSVGLLVVPAALAVVLLEWARRRQWLYGVASLGAVGAGFAIPEALWLLVKTVQEVGAESVSGYQEDTYLANLVQFLTEWRVFKACLRLGLNQWLGVGLASGGVFLLFGLDLIVRPSRSLPPSVRTLAVYYLLAAAGLTLAALMHMWRGYLLRGDARFALLARYMDPLAPMVVLWGTLGLVRLREGQAGRTARLRLAVMALGGLAVFLTTFPMDGYKFPNVLSVWYVEPMREFLDPAPTEAVDESPAAHVAPPSSGAATPSPPRGEGGGEGRGFSPSPGRERAPGAGVPQGPGAEPLPATRARRPSLGDRLGLPSWWDVRRIVITVAALVFLAPFILRPRFLSGGYVPWTVGLLVLLNVPLILQQVRVSRDADRMNAIPKWLCDHAAPGERLYFDEGDYYRGKGMYLFYATCFWNPRMEIGRHRREVAALDPQYVISWDRFGAGSRVLQEAGLGPDRRYLYGTEGTDAAAVILDDPRYFDVARLPPGSVEDAWAVEADAWVWTKRQTRFRFQYDLPRGPWVLALSAGGPRPRYNPAKLRITLDGHLLRLPNEEDPSLSHTKGPGNAVWRFAVPAGAASAGSEHVLEIQTNVFVPSRDLTDNPDDRELGVQVFWFKIEDEKKPSAVSD